MKLNPLTLTTSSSALASPTRMPHATEQVLPVNAMAGLGGDRERSLQQEMACIEAQAIADFAGEELMLEKAQQLAAEVSGLGHHIDVLIKPLNPASSPYRGIDDEV